MGLPIKETVVNGKKRIIIMRVATGEEHAKEAILTIMKGYEFKDDSKLKAI